MPGKLPGNFMYDIIGDIHGQADLLKGLLKKMGYQQQNGIFAHPKRKAVFVGDFINRGPQIRTTLRLVRSMVEAGSAYAILGNHELNAIFFYLKDQRGIRINKRSSKLRLNLFQTLDEFVGFDSEWKNHVRWLRSLPMFLDFGDIRVVHACWRDENINLLKEFHTDTKLTKSFLRKISKNNTDISRAFWETCKGIDFLLPKDLLVFDDFGTPHRSFRSKWWVDPQGLSFRDLSFESRFELPNYTIPAELTISREPYSSSAPLVFFGHYCMKNGKNIISENICCLDSCVSRNGKLTAYQWNGEKALLDENLIKI